MAVANKVCVVTGASSGIGRATALALAERGAEVCVAARREDRLKSLVDEMGGEESGHSHVVADVSVRKQAAAIADHVRERYSRCDVLVNNAGFSKERPFDEPGAVADIEKVMKTNFFGILYCTHEFLPMLIEAAPSSVVNVSSVAGRLGLGGTPGYSSSKFAIVGLSEGLHFQLEDKGVNVCVVEPGLIPTEGFPQTPLLTDPLLKYALGTPEDVAKAIIQAIERREWERVVPRWYYLLQLPRLIAPPLYRYVQKKFVMPRQKEMEG